MMKNRQHIRKSKKKLKKAKKKTREVPVADLLKAASAAMESLDVERAYKAYHQAASQLQREKLSAGINQEETTEVLIHTLEKMGECQVSIGDQDLARSHFLQSLQLLEQRVANDSPQNMSYFETHSSLCFYIGQLSLATEALEAYQQGIRSLEKCMQLAESENSLSTTQNTLAMTVDVQTEDSSMKTDTNMNFQFRTLLLQKLSGAYCNLAELYLTDLCEEETAENDCERYLEKALDLRDADGEPFADALQTMASLRLSQREKQLEAVPFIIRAYEKQRVGSEALATLVGIQEGKEACDSAKGNPNRAKELVEVEAANNLPEFEFRCQTAKLLLECAELLKESSNDMDVTPTNNGQHNECVKAAISVLGSLLAQNDEVIEIWYLTGCAFAAKTPPSIDTARFYLERAREMLTDIQKALNEEAQFADESGQLEIEGEIEKNVAQLGDVQLKLDELPCDEKDGSSDEMMEG